MGAVPLKEGGQRTTAASPERRGPGTRRGLEGGCLCHERIAIGAGCPVIITAALRSGGMPWSESGRGRGAGAETLCAWRGSCPRKSSAPPSTRACRTSRWRLGRFTLIAIVGGEQSAGALLRPAEGGEEASCRPNSKAVRPASSPVDRGRTERWRLQSSLAVGKAQGSLLLLRGCGPGCIHGFHLSSCPHWALNAKPAGHTEAEWQGLGL